jgi:RNA polymerase sigma factor (sigma-70 family)
LEQCHLSGLTKTIKLRTLCDSQGENAMMELKYRDGSCEQAIVDLWPEIPKAVRGACASQWYRDRETEDLCQQVVLMLIQSDYHRFRSFDDKKSSLKTWLSVVIRNHTRRHLQRRRRLRTAEENWAESFPCQSSIETGILFKQRKLILQQALRRLTEPERQLYELLCRDDLGNADIAGMMNISPDSVRKRRYRLVRKLQRLIVHE